MNYFLEVNNITQFLINVNATFVNIPLEGASSPKKINEIEIGKNKEKSLATIQQAYAKASFCKVVYPLITEITLYNNDNLALFISNRRN